MKRIVAVLAAILFSVAGFFLVMSSLVSVDNARQRAIGELAAWTGRDVSVGDKVELSLFPAPRLTMNELRVAGPRGNGTAGILSAKRIQADIQILPLLIGRIRFNALVLTKPEIRLVVDAKGKRNWRFDGGPAGVQLALSGDLPFGRITFKDAIVTYDNIQRNEQETVLIPDLMLDWESIHQPAAMRGSVVMRDERIAFDGRIASPMAFLNRKSTGLTATLRADMLNARLEGKLADYKAVRFAGQLDASGPSLRRIMAFFGGADPTGAGLGAVEISGRADIKRNELFIEQGQIELDDNAATGSLSVTFGEKPKLSGTLAFRNLNLTPYLHTFSGPNPANWSQRHFDTSWFGKLDADLRLSADRVLTGPYTFGSTAASVLLKDNQLEIGLAQSMFYGGVISGNISVANLVRSRGQATDIQLRATEFNLGQAITTAGGPADLGGTATMSVDLQTFGRALGQQFANLSGSVSLISLNGATPDLGLDAASNALAVNEPLNGSSRGGSGLYQRLEIDALIDKGTMAFKDLVFKSNAYSASLNGKVDLDGGELDLAGTLRAAEPASQQGRIEIRGPVSSPIITMTPDDL